MSITPTVGLFAPLTAKTDKAEDTANFLRAGAELLEGEPLTREWFGFVYTSVVVPPSTTIAAPTYAIFDTFAANEGRTAHLTGNIAAALMANADALLSSPPEINTLNILASKVNKSDVKVGLRVLAEAKPEKVEEVKQFLISALPLAEAEELTPLWYAVQLTDSKGAPTAKFGIFDFSETEAGRQAHLDGQIAAALFAKADEFFVASPEVVKVDVIASRVL